MTLLAAFVLVGTVAAQGFDPPRFREGSLPARPSPQVVAGGQVLLEVVVGGDGAVAEVTTLRDTPPFTGMLREAVTGWRFRAATEDGRGRAWPVLVAGIFRPPALAGPVAGIPPRDIDTPCSEIPVPLGLVVPAYPPTTLGDAMLLVELGVEADGTVADPRILEGNGPFAQPALDAARGMRFRPACRHGRPVSVSAYLVLGFRSPISLPRPPGGSP
jgi:hypothetical protein